MLPIASNTAAGFTLGDLTTVLLIGSATLIFCALAVRLSARTGLQSLLIYLGVGPAMDVPNSGSASTSRISNTPWCSAMRHWS